MAPIPVTSSPAAVENSLVPSFALNGKLTIITGGSGGVGSVIARAFLLQGSEIALVDYEEKRTEESAEELRKWFKSTNPVGTPQPEVSAWFGDVGNSDLVEETVTQINHYHHKLATVLVHTAGFCENIPALEYPAVKAERLIQTNLMGSLYFSRAVARPLIEAGIKGSICLIASMSGSIVNTPQPQCAYNMSKAGVIHLAKSLACEWATKGIRVNTLSPGYILTPLTQRIFDEKPGIKETWEAKIPMNRMASPSEFVGPLLFMASEASSYMTGNDLRVDGGYSCW